MNMKPIRWGDNDHYFGPCTYARGMEYSPLAVVLRSGGDNENYAGCSMRLSGFGHTFIVALPPIIRPWREKVTVSSWNAEMTARLGRDWYWNVDRREYGFSYSDGFLQVFLGRQTNDSSTTQSWAKFLPWTQWRHVRRSFYGLEGNHFATLSDSGVSALIDIGLWEREKAMEVATPTVTFLIFDFDGELVSVETRMEEREWRFGTGWFKWLSIFRSPRVSRSLDLEFSKEVGERKGSWKGGTLGHSIEMLPGELHEAAFKRYCSLHNMTFIKEQVGSQGGIWRRHLGG